jgi:hypothetical protein
MHLDIRTTFAGLALATAALAGDAMAQSPSSADTSCAWDARCNAPGATLTLVETDRAKKSNAGTTITYRASTAGLPAGHAYTLWMRRIDGRAQWIVAGYAADPAGGMRCADRAAFAELAKQAGDGWCPVPFDSLTFGLGAMMPGEPVEFALRAADGSAAAYARVVPHPVQATADGCTLAVSVADPSRKSVLVSGSGFAPGERVRRTSISGGETMQDSATVAADGTLPPTMLLPATKGAGRGGEATLEVAGSKCAVRLPYVWGNKLRAI